MWFGLGLMSAFCALWGVTMIPMLIDRGRFKEIEGAREELYGNFVKC